MSFFGFAFGFGVYSILKVLNRALDNPRNNEELLKEIKRQNEVIELNSYQLDIVQKVSNQTSLNVDRICTALQEGLDSYKALKHLCIVAFREWLNFDLFNKRDVSKLHKNLSSFSSYLYEFSIKILQYSQKLQPNVIAFCYPKKTDDIFLTYTFFAKQNFIEQQAVLLHELTHTFLLTKDFCYNSYGKRIANSLKRKNADNWAMCYKEIITPFNGRL